MAEIQRAKFENEENKQFELGEDTQEVLNNFGQN
jgi:hypothetical protein